MFKTYSLLVKQRTNRYRKSVGKASKYWFDVKEPDVFVACMKESKLSNSERIPSQTNYQVLSDN